MERLGLFLGNRGAGVQSLAQQAAAILSTYNASMYLAGADARTSNTEDIQSNALQTSDGVVGYIGDAATSLVPSNYYMNSEMAGAGVGVQPTGWMAPFASNGISVAVVGAGTDVDGSYIDYRFNGTSTATNSFPAMNILGTADRPATKPGDVWSAAMTIEVVAGTFLPHSCYLQMQEQNSVYGFTTASYTYLTELTRVRLTNTKLMAHASTVFVTANFQLTVPLGESVDVTFRVRKPQFSRGILQDYVPTPVSGPLLRSYYIPAYKTTTAQKPILRGKIVNYCAYNMDMELGASSATVTALSYTQYANAGRVGRYAETAAVANHTLNITGGSVLPSMPNNSLAYVSVKVKVINASSKGTLVRVQGRTNDGAGYCSATFNLLTGTFTSVSGGALSGTISGPDVEGFYTLAVFYNTGVGTSGNAAYVNFNGGITEAGDTDFTLEIGCVKRGIGSAVPADIVNNGAKAIASSSYGPYHWEFDGTDDRIDISNPTLNFNSPSFRLLAFKLPETADTATRVLAGSYSNISARGLQIYLPLNTLDVKVSTKDETGAGPDFGNIRLGNENLIVSAKVTTTEEYIRIRGDKSSPFIGTSAIATATWTPVRERIGCYSPNGSDGIFSNHKIYGMISGNGNITPAEMEVLENFLAALYEITLLP